MSASSPTDRRRGSAPPAFAIALTTNSPSSLFRSLRNIPQLLTTDPPSLPCPRRRRGRHPCLAVAQVAPARVPPRRLYLDEVLVLGPAPRVEHHALVPADLAALVLTPHPAQVAHRRGVGPALGEEVTPEP